MSQPPKYSPQHAFVSDSATLANFPGQALDVEFQGVKAVTDAIETNLALLQRDDGTLGIGLVGYDQLAPSLQTNGIAPAQGWATATAYKTTDSVITSNALYRCEIAHTSGTFSVDLAAGKWTYVATLQVPPMTKADIGLGNVDNTSDVNKPVSTAQAAALALKAPLASPAFTGTPTAPTAPSNTNNTQVATTAYADGAVAVEKSRAQTAEGLLAPLASPTFTGTPTAPTASLGTNTTQLATTAFVLANASSVTAGQLPATATNDNAASGKLGEYIETGSCNNNATATVSMTIASPCVVTWTAHKFTVGAATTAIKFTTTGALPTGVTSGTTYYVKAIDANTFNIATSADNALAGTFVGTSGSQSGTHTGDIRVSMTAAVQQNIAAISLGAGDWDVSAQLLKACAATTTVTFIGGNLSLVSAAVDRTFGRRLTFQYGGLTLNNNEFTVFDFVPTRFSFASTTTIYLVGDDTFATSTLTSSGWIRARRAR